MKHHILHQLMELVFDVIMLLMCSFDPVNYYRDYLFMFWVQLHDRWWGGSEVENALSVQHRSIYLLIN